MFEMLGSTPFWVINLFLQNMLLWDDAPWPEEESEEEVFEETAGHSQSLPCLSIKRMNNQKTHWMPCLCPQCSHNERECQVGDNCKDAKEVMLLGPTEVERGKGDGGQEESTNRGSHQKGKKQTQHVSQSIDRAGSKQ